MSTKKTFNFGEKTVWILRGPPGSGKTSVGKKLKRVLLPNVYISLDQIREEKGYADDWGRIVENMKADVSVLEERFRRAVFEDRVNDVIVDNCHSRLWEYERFLKVAADANYTVHVLEVQADLVTCWERQRHGVPWDKLLEIFKRWESPVRLPSKMDLFKILVDLNLRT